MEGQKKLKLTDFDDPLLDDAHKPPKKGGLPSADQKLGMGNEANDDADFDALQKEVEENPDLFKPEFTIKQPKFDKNGDLILSKEEQKEVEEEVEKLDKEVGTVEETDEDREIKNLEGELPDDTEQMKEDDEEDQLIRENEPGQEAAQPKQGTMARLGGFFSGLGSKIKGAGSALGSKIKGLFSRKKNNPPEIQLEDLNEEEEEKAEVEEEVKEQAEDQNEEDQAQQEEEPRQNRPQAAPGRTWYQRLGNKIKGAGAAIGSKIKGLFSKKKEPEEIEMDEMEPEEEEKEQGKGEKKPNEEKPAEEEPKEEGNEEEPKEEGNEEEAVDEAVEEAVQPKQGMGARLGGFFAGLGSKIKGLGSKIKGIFTKKEAEPPEIEMEEEGEEEEEEEIAEIPECEALKGYLDAIGDTGGKDSAIMTMVKNQMETVIDAMNGNMPKTVDGINGGAAAMAGMLRMLGNSCRTYVSTHKNPKTGKGEDRLALVRSIWNLSVSMASGAVPKASLTAMYLQRGGKLEEDHKWGDIYVLSAKPVEVQINPEDMLEGEPQAQDGDGDKPKGGDEQKPGDNEKAQGAGEKQKDALKEKEDEEKPKEDDVDAAAKEEKPSAIKMKNIRVEGPMFKSALPALINGTSKRVNEDAEKAGPGLQGRQKKVHEAFIKSITLLNETLGETMPKDPATFQEKLPEVKRKYATALRASNLMLGENAGIFKESTSAVQILRRRLIAEHIHLEAQSAKFLQFHKENNTLGQDHKWSEVMENVFAADAGEGTGYEDATQFRVRNPLGILSDYLASQEKAVQDAPQKGIGGDELQQMQDQMAMVKSFKQALGWAPDKKRDAILGAILQLKEDAFSEGSKDGIPAILGKNYKKLPFWTRVEAVDKEKLVKALEPALKVKAQNDFIRNTAGIKMGTKTALMGVAMSRLAESLGVGDIVQKEMAGYSQGGDAKKLGVYSEGRKGTPLGELAETMEKDGKHVRYSPEATKQLTNLQVLDYLCNNMGRKMDNILVEYDSDAEGALVKSVKGYDNSISFGEGVADKDTNTFSIQNFARKAEPPKADDEEGNDEQQQDHFRTLFEAMDPELSKRIIEMKESTLEVEMAGLLTPAQIELAKKRLRNLQRVFSADKKLNEKKYNPDDDIWRQIGEKGYSFKSYLIGMKPKAQA